MNDKYLNAITVNIDNDIDRFTSKLSNFQYLGFSSCVLFAMVVKELSSMVTMNKAEIVDQAKYVIEQLSLMVEHLEATDGTNR